MTQISTRAGGSALTIIFDSHVIKVFDVNSSSEWTTSGQTFTPAYMENTLKVELQPGYILNSVILTNPGASQPQRTLAISADGLSFNHPPFEVGSSGTTLTITTTKPSKNINARITFKHDIEANWKQATNFTPKAGELILYDPDAKYDYTRIKLGDGSTKVNDLPFLFDKLHDLEVNLGSYLAFLVKEKGE